MSSIPTAKADGTVLTGVSETALLTLEVRANEARRNTRRYLVDHPRATVVALAEGLQTSFYRLDAAGVSDQFQWLTVDLPPMIELRRKLLPASDRVRMCAQSALDFSWMDQVEPKHGVFITTEGC